MGVFCGSRDIEKSDIKPILLTFCKGKQAMGALPRAANGVFVVIHGYSQRQTMHSPV